MSLSFLTQVNTERVERQKAAPIFVIIGNPPYNAHQVNENDNSHNSKYKVLDDRVSQTYAERFSRHQQERPFRPVCKGLQVGSQIASKKMARA